MNEGLAVWIGSTVWDVFKLLMVFIIPPIITIPLFAYLIKSKNAEKYKIIIYFSWCLMSIGLLYVFILKN